MFWKKRGFKLFIVVMVVTTASLLLSAGCKPKKASGAEYKVGVVLSTTGPNGPLGTPEQQALTLYEKQLNDNGGINGRPIKFIILDDASDPTKASSAMTDLVKSQNVLAVIGSSGTGTTMPMVDIAQQANVPLEACAAGIKVTTPTPGGPPNKWVFRTPPTDAMAAEKVVDYLASGLKVKKVAILYDSNPFGSSGNEVLKTLLPTKDMVIVSDQSYETKATDMTPQLNNVKGTDAQALIVWGTNPAPSAIAKNMKQMGMTIPFVGSHGIANMTFVEQAGDAANGAVFPAGRMAIPESIPEGTEWRDVVDKFRADFKAEYGSEPNTFAGHGWDAGVIVANALKISGEDRSKLRDEIENTKDFAAVGGVFNYSTKDHNGLNADDLIMVKVVNGQWQWLKY